MFSTGGWWNVITRRLSDALAVMVLLRMQRTWFGSKAALVVIPPTLKHCTTNNIGSKGEKSCRHRQLEKIERLLLLWSQEGVSETIISSSYWHIGNCAFDASVNIVGEMQMRRRWNKLDRDASSDEDATALRPEGDSSATRYFRCGSRLVLRELFVT